MDKKKLLIVIGLVVLLLAVVFLLLLLGGVFGTQASGGDKNRANKLALARDYLSRGEYDRALDLVDQVLLDNINDAEAAALKDEILNRKKLAENERRATAERDRRREMALLEDMKNRNPAVDAKTTRTTVAIPNNASNAEKERLRKIQDLLDKAKDYQDAKQYDKARDAYNEVLKLDPNSAEAHARIAETYLKEDPTNPDNQDKAKELSLKAIDEDPKLALPHYTLAQIDEQNKRYADAEREYKEATRLDPKDYMALYKLGNIQYRLGKYADATRSYASCVKLKSDFYRAYFNKGMAHEKLSQGARAIDAFKSVVRIQHDFHAAYYELAGLYRESGDLSAAISAAKNATLYGPGNAKYFTLLGNIYIDAKRYTDAENALLAGLNLDPANPASNYNLANLKILTGKYAEALSYAQTAEQRAPNVKEYANTVGFAYDKLGEREKAIAEYKKAIDLDGRYVIALVNLGKLYDDAGLPDEALPYLTRAYAQEPNSTLVNNVLGTAYLHKKSYVDAITYLAKAVSLSPSDAQVRYNLGLAYLETGKDLEAKQAFSDVLKLNPNYWDAYYQFGRVLIKEGDKANAKQILNQLLAKNPGYEKADEVRTMVEGL